MSNCIVQHYIIRASFPGPRAPLWVTASDKSCMAWDWECSYNTSGGMVKPHSCSVQLYVAGLKCTYIGSLFCPTGEEISTEWLQ